MNKALLHNFPAKLDKYGMQSIDDPDLMIGGRNDVDFFMVGMDLVKSGLVGAELRSDILSALILHDKLCMNIFDIIQLINLFGVDNCIRFLESKSFEVYDDLDTGSAALIIDSNKYKLTESRITDGDEKLKKISWLEATLSKLEINREPIKAEQIKQILMLLVSNTISSKNNYVSQLLLKEITHDIKNVNVTKLFDISSTDIDSISKNDLPKIMRLGHINKGLIDAKLIEADSIMIDGWGKTFLRGKLSPVMNDNALYSSVDIFRNIIMSGKGIPDLNLLFENKIIDANDIIDFRETVDGRLFRKWISGINYDPDAILSTLLNKKYPSLKSKITNHVRFIYPKVIGLIDPISGFVASVCDSYIVQKIMDGWHPSLFLDDELRFKIDQNIEFQKKQTKSDLLNKIKKVGRNDPCCCGSGKKFKKCCGR